MLIVKETKNIRAIDSVLKHPDIYPLISNDNSPKPEDFKTPLDGCRYFLGLLDEKVIALMVYHDYLDGEKCHVQVLPEYRKKYAVEFGKKALLFRDKSKPLYADIPRLHRHIILYCIPLGFKITGTKKEQYVKNGVQYPITTLKYTGV